ncbi:MAG TPA: L,D-transpeptidase family protein, partial [Sphingomicrobium sp.]|nr:L,D-transpeptidase family protein [Sphingomicrobium sp.]
FYKARQWQAAWDDASEKQLLEIINGAPSQGMKRELFIKAQLPQDRSEREIALTKAALRYASALAQGYSDPKAISKVYTLPRAKVDVAGGLASALGQQNGLKDWYASLPPQTDDYRALAQAFARYATLNDVQGDLSDGKALKPGGSDPRVPALAKALVANGYLDGEPGESTRYSAVMVRAVKALQAEYGIKPDGIVGEGTIAILNKGPGDRARQIAVNMERLRWLERNPPETRIDVNTAAATLEYWRSGSLRDRRNVVVGQPDWETPQLGSPIVQLVAHPYWRVPKSILEDELNKKSPAYLQDQGLEWRDDRLVQLPGPKNALGDVKFDMRNDQAIYLHDTPAKALFGLPERHRSHGCVRVEGALDFAMLLASDDGILIPFQEALMKLDEEGFVKLRKEVPVRLMYLTAFLDNGQVRLVDDVYGWDDDVAYALGYVRRPPRAKVKREAGDVGP